MADTNDLRNTIYTTLYKCSYCGAPVDVTMATDGVGKCKYCGVSYTLPKLNSSALTYLDLGLTNLDMAKFADAYAYFTRAIKMDSDDCELYWCRALATERVQYLNDLINKCPQPICFEITERKFVDNSDYQKALSLATKAQRDEYERKAKSIDDIRKEFLRLKNLGLKYDCFICVKVTDGEYTTKDYRDAIQLYQLLKNKGFNPFFSEINLTGKGGEDYEAHILYALYSSDSMIIICSNQDYLQTDWVKNEYTRYLRLIDDEEKDADSLTVLFRGTPIERIGDRRKKIQGIDLDVFGAESAVLAFVEKHSAKCKQQQTKLKVAGSAPQPEIAEHKPQLNQPQIVVEDDDFKMEGGELKRYKGTKRDVVIPQGVTKIGRYAFYNCNSMRSLSIPDSVTAIDEYAFYNCNNLKSITFPDSIKSIAGHAFYNCNGLVDVVLPNCLTELSRYLFYACNSLSCVKIPNSVQKISSYAFYNCDNLTSITIPASVQIIERLAFHGCDHLKINCCVSVQPEGWQDSWDIYRERTEKSPARRCETTWKIN
jgi:tetratricopeptide (TPR) repeat protein